MGNERGSTMNKRQFSFFIFLSIIAGWLGGAASNFVLRDEVAMAQTEEEVVVEETASEEPKRPELEAQRFVIRDEVGRTRVVLGLVNDSPTLSFFDPKGNVLIELGLTQPPRGNPYLIFLDRNSKDRLLLTVHETKGTELFFYDTKGRVSWGAP